ncbi:transporter [Phocaeicola dorei]|uniref:transporter n=1 Tax=Phocaeicola dorei TaxID=357276 RepID=UPI001896B484|nr:transporter [Phocaeicola dorei]MBT9912870.1 transporter [Phocaeicola dorei]MCB6966928.1 transporter [Phocaeicola dorei]MCG4616368.1 transporter [Phocaeicola dorei]MCG4639534.1 transporter [Phocaeicola dorei]
MERGIITITENGVVTMPTAPVWMTQQEMSDAFNVFGCDIRKVVHAIYKNGELLESETKRYIRQDNGINYDVYSLEMIIAIAFKLRTKECMTFRRFIMDKLCSFNRGNSIHLFFSLSDTYPRCTC